MVAALSARASTGARRKGQGAGPLHESLTTRLKAAAITGGPGGRPFEDVPVYLVVLTGHFTDERFPLSPQTTILAYAVDATSHRILDIARYRGPIDAKAVAQMTSFTVPPSFAPSARGGRQLGR